jgi:hypothetical protein
MMFFLPLEFPLLSRVEETVPVLPKVGALSRAHLSERRLLLAVNSVVNCFI